MGWLFIYLVAGQRKNLSRNCKIWTPPTKSWAASSIWAAVTVRSLLNLRTASRDFEVKPRNVYTTVALQQILEIAFCHTIYRQLICVVSVKLGYVGLSRLSFNSTSMYWEAHADIFGYYGSKLWIRGVG